MFFIELRHFLNGFYHKFYYLILCTDKNIYFVENLQTALDFSFVNTFTV